MKNIEIKNSMMNDNIQKQLLKLISEEYYAYQLYVFSKLAVNSQYIGAIYQLFDKIAIDEFQDHMAELIKWCKTYDYDIPCSEKEFKKYADPKIYKIVQDLKKNQDAVYYIQEAIKQENLSIKSYKNALNTKNLCEFTDLQSLLWNIYYEEEEHLSELNSSLIAIEANADLILM